MPDITIVKLKIRRGTDLQRQSVVLEQGELGLTVDTKRVFVGDGVTSGGNVVGNKVWPPITATGVTRASLTNAVIGDIVSDHNLLYQLVGANVSTDWTYIGPQVDNATLTLSGANNILAIPDYGITGSKFGASAAFNGLAVTGGVGIGANVDGTTIVVNGSNQLAVSSIDQNNIVTSALGNGLQGGSGTAISLNVDPTTFGYLSGSSVLSITAVPANTVKVSSLSSTGFVGIGLNTNNNLLNTTIQGVDSTLAFTAPNIGLKSGYAAGASTPTHWQSTIFDTYGRIQTTVSTIVTTLTANNAVASISGFNGAPNQISKGYGNYGLHQTLVPVLSADVNGTLHTMTLSSAGFIVFASTSTQNGSAFTVDKFAIPVFSLPQ